MNFFEALIYGLIQGITEFIPVSSSGHLTLLGRIFGTDPEAMLTLTAWLHMGTLIAVFVVMRKEIKEILGDLLGPRTWQLVLATIPAIVAAVLLGDWLESLFGGGLLGYSFLVTGILLLSTMFRRQAAGDKEKEIGYREALIAGTGQAVAIIPGISRSGSTLTALLFTGIDRQKAIRFSFLMSIPAIFGGFLFDLIGLVRNQGEALATLGIGNIIVGVIASGVSGYLAMEWMLKKLTRRGFLYCAIYVLALGLLVLIDQTWTGFFF